MNKYQKAIETLRNSGIRFLIYKGQGFDDEAPTMFDFYHHEMFILQELVDKATPKKKKIYAPLGLELCPTCGKDTYREFFKYCPYCGQRLEYEE